MSFKLIRLDKEVEFLDHTRHDHVGSHRRERASRCCLPSSRASLPTLTFLSNSPLIPLKWEHPKCRAQSLLRNQWRRLLNTQM